MSAAGHAMSSFSMVQNVGSRGFGGRTQDMEEALSRAVDGRFSHPAGWSLPPWVESRWVSWLDSSTFLCFSSNRLFV